jgi:alpha-galactosidase
VTTGLHALGYVYVNVDDCWAKGRNSSGYIQPDNKTFPHMVDLIEHVHSLGLKFGLYSSAGDKTCAGRPGSLGHETKDAILFAAWKVDYFKYDHCHTEGHDLQTSYTVMRDALNATKRPIFYSLCDGGQEGVAKWSGPIGNSWRTTKDIRDDWNDMMNRIHLNDQWWKYGGPGGWNDPDMLEVGNGGMTAVEDKTHFSLWSIAKAPLIIGCDLRTIKNDTLEILSNTEVIAVNQDKLGVQGHVVWKNKDGDQEVWSSPLSSGDVAMVLLNMGEADTTMTVELSVVGLKSAKARDLWLHKDLGEMDKNITARVESHGVVMLRLTPPPAQQSL